jgi:hypothetical protein
MASFLSIHDVKIVRASTVQDGDGCSPHITLSFEGDNYDVQAQVTVYLPNAEFNQRLIDLINDASDALKPVDVSFTPKYPVVEDEDETSF